MNFATLSLATALSLAIAGTGSAQTPAPPTSTPPTAAAPEEDARTVIRDNDGALTCMQIADEAAELSQTMGQPSGGGVFGVLGGVARTGAAMLVPGAGLLMAGADVVTQPGRDRRESAETAVEQRWYYLNGLYAGLRCNPEAQAQAQPQAEPAVTTSAGPAPSPAISPVALTAAPD